MRESIVTRVDHVFVPLAQVEPAFRFLTETLALPQAWPLAAYGAFTSGGVVLGAANFEVLQSDAALPATTAHRPARVQGIAFDPVRADETTLAELDRRGIPHSPAIPVEGTRFGRTGLLWTNVFFSDFIDDRALVFLCRYALPESRDVAARRALLQAADGGRLGIEDLDEIVVSSRDPRAAERRWQRLLDPLRPSAPGYWRSAEGPALRIVGGDEEAVATLVLRVRSLARAEAELRAVGVGVRRDGDVLAVNAPPLAGLELRLVGG
jgi:hypothetical protein